MNIISTDFCEVEYLRKQNSSDNVFLSVVIPTFKRKELLAMALYSIAKYSINYPNVEVIVLSNDPNDNLDELCTKYNSLQFSVLRNRANIGMCGNINQCLRVAKGEYISYLHDDDLLAKNFLPVIFQAITENPDADCIIPARYRLIGNSKSEIIKQWLKFAFSSLFIKNKINKKPYHITIEDVYKTGRNCFSAPSCGTTFKKKSVLKEGGFPQEWEYTFDFIFYIRFCRKYKVILLKEPLGIYRTTESASNKANVQLEFFMAQKFALECNKDMIAVRKYYYEYLHLFAKGLSKETQNLINQKYSDEMRKWSKIKYLFLRMRTEIYYHSSGIEAGRYLSKKRRKELVEEKI